MLQPFISYAFNSTIWRLEIDEICGILVLELRDQQDKRVSFAAVDLKTGEKYFDDHTTPERWMTGLEAIYDGVILLHHYKHESGPEHKAIVAVDARTSQQKWSNYSLTFDHLSTNGPICYNANIQPVKLMLADIATGQLLRPYADTDKPLQNNIVVPDMMSSTQSPLEHFGYEAYGNIVHCLNHNNYRIVSLHALEGKVLQQHLFIMNGNHTVYHDLLNTDIQKLQPEAFVLHQNSLIYIKNKAELKVINL